MEALSEENSDLSSVDASSISDLANISNTVVDICENEMVEPVMSDVKVEESAVCDEETSELVKKEETDEQTPTTENVLRFESGIADGYIILSREAAASLGMNSNTATVETEVTEPATKRFRFQGEDGQSYVLTVADNTAGGTTEIVPDQSKIQAPVAVEVGEQPIPVATAMATVPIVTNTPSVSEQLLGAAGVGKKTQGSSDVTQAWFTTRFDKVAMQNKGASWKQGQWTKEEIDVLQCNIDSYCRDRGISDPTEIIFGMSKDERKDFYRTVAKGLQRPLFSVYRRVTRMYDQKNHIGKYSAEEMSRLRELRAKYGNDWASIGSVLGRSASSVKDKCRLMRDTCNSGKWLPEEENRLSSAVYELAGVKPGENVTSGLSWASVAERVLTRSEKQCRTKWLNFLNWKQKGGTEWTREDDINLVVKISNLGVSDDTEIDWNDLAKNWPSVRSPQWLRGKWWSLKRHVPDYQLLSFSDLIVFLKNVHLQNVRMKNPVSSNMRVSPYGVQRPVTATDMTTLQIPMSLNTNLQSVPLQTSTTLDTGVESETPFQTFEVLHQTNSGTFLITQPQTNPVISLSGAAMSTDHIIVHTLPTQTMRGNENVTVQMNPTPVILSTGPTTDGVTEGVTLDTAEINSSVQLPDAITQPDPDLQPLSQDDQLPEDENVISQSALDSGDHLNSQDQIIGETFQTEVTDIVSSSADAADLVMVSTTTQQFVQTAGNNNELVSSSDPMLPSGGSDLIGSSSDIEGEKNHSQISENDITSSDISGADS